MFFPTLVCDHIRVPSEFRSPRRAREESDKLSISRRLRKENKSTRNANKTHNEPCFGDSDGVRRYFAIPRRNVWDGLMLRVGIIIFHLFFILILLKRARPSERGKLARSVFPSCPGMFLRGVLEVGHGGPEERAHKQVAGRRGGTR